jgi:hypothetical protein
MKLAGRNEAPSTVPSRRAPQSERERCDHQGGHTDPVFDEVRMHSDVGGRFSVPVTGALQLVETELQSILEGDSKSDS